MRKFDDKLLVRKKEEAYERERGSNWTLARTRYMHQYLLGINWISLATSVQLSPEKS